MGPLNENQYGTDVLKWVFYKMVFIITREDRTCGLAVEYIRTSFMLAQSEAKDLNPGGTALFEIMKEFHVPIEVVHVCQSDTCSCLHNSSTGDLDNCTCDIDQIKTVEITIAKHSLRKVLHADIHSIPEDRTKAALLAKFRYMCSYTALSTEFYNLRENISAAIEQCWSNWQFLTGYSGVCSDGDVAALHQKDWPLTHNCARVLSMTTPTLLQCIHTERFANFPVNLGIGKHKLPRILCYITRDSLLYCAYMAHSEHAAVVGALRVLLYHAHQRLPWSLHQDPTLGCVAERFAQYTKLGEFRSDYPYEDV